MLGYIFVSGETFIGRQLQWYSSMSEIIDELEKRGSTYVTRKIYRPKQGGCRVSVPREWEGDVVVVLNPRNMLKHYIECVEQMKRLMDECERMRRMTEEEFAELPCKLVIGELYKKTRRENEVCRQCPISKRIDELSAEIKDIHADELKEITIDPIAEEFFDDLDTPDK